MTFPLSLEYILIRKYLLWTVFTIIIPSGHCLITLKQDNKTHYVPGALRSDLPDPLFYSTFIPVVYEIVLPQWNETTLNVRWPENYSTHCKSSDTFEDDWKGFACPVMHYLLDVVERFNSSLLGWKVVGRSTKPGKSAIHSCQEITPHFTSNTIGHDELDEYLHEDLKSCSLQPSVYRKLDNYDMNRNLSSLYTLMLSEFIEEFVTYDKRRVTGFNRYSSTTNAYMALQGLQLLEYFTAANKWTEGMNMCDDGKLPYSLIPPKMLTDALQEVQRTLDSGDNKKYALAIDEQDFSSYYSHDLADCTFTTRGTYLVRMLVPLKKTDVQYKLGTITPFPFLRHYGESAEVCEYDYDDHLGGMEQELLIEQHSGMAFSIECPPGVLCFVPEVARRPMQDYCLHAIIRNSTEDILQYCRLECNPFLVEHLPYFRRLNSNTFAVIGNNNADIFIDCDNKPYKVVYPPMPVGALEVTLPCSCRIISNSEVFEPSAPCATNDELIIREIQPYAWSSNVSAHWNRSELDNDFRPNFPAGRKRRRYFQSFESKKKLGVMRQHHHSDKLIVKFYGVSALVVLLLCFCIGLLITVVRLNRRIILLEKSSSNNNHGFPTAFDNPLQTYIQQNE